MNILGLRVVSSAGVDLGIAVEAIFGCFALIGFFRVSQYVGEQAKQHALLNGPQAPPPFAVSSLHGWGFIISTMLLLYLGSPLYLFWVVLGLAFFLIETGRTAKDQFGLHRLRPGKVVKWSLLICGAVFCLEVPLTIIIDFIMTAIHLPHPEQESVETFRKFSRVADILLFLVMAVGVAPLIEELFFRGFLVTFLKRYTSTWLAIILGAGIFAFAHVNLGSALQLWLLGIALGIAYQHTGSLLLSIGIHGCFNLVSAILLLLDKGNS